MTLDLPAIRARAEAATPGPWFHNEHLSADDYMTPYYFIGTGTSAMAATDVGSADLSPDSEFIAHARTDIPALLAEVERLSRNLEAASAECCDLSAYRQLVREEHPAEVAALTAEVERLREQLPRVARWVAAELRPDLSPAEIDALVAEALEATRG